MHDCVGLEAEGKPTVVVASEEFTLAAAVQAEALGMPDLPVVCLPHPIQDRTDDEMRALADDAIDAILKALISQ